MRLIDADELERDLESLKQDYEDEGCDSKRIDGIDDCIEEIRCAKPVDSEPVVHAHWIPYESETGEGSNTYKCSSCGGIQIIIYGTPKENRWNYCPHCGAKMDEEENKA